MAYLSAKLRSGENCYFHWCPGCLMRHRVTVGVKNALGSEWTFNGDVDKPTFSPSVNNRMTYKDGYVGRCHYFLTEGVLNFCSDTTHEFSGRSVPLPNLP